MQHYVPLFVNGELVLVSVRQKRVDAAEAMLQNLHALFVASGAYAELCEEIDTHIVRGYN